MGPARAPLAWQQRMITLQNSASWQLDGRAAAAMGTQGWQASLNWRQRDAASEIRLSGPFGVGTLLLKKTPEGVSLNGAPPSDAALTLLQERLGVELPLDYLRYWLLGVPDPSSAFELNLNPQDRPAQLTQVGWSVKYDRFMPVDGDWLPAHLVLQHAGARVRISVDRWTLEP